MRTFPPTPPAELDRIERQLAAALRRARDLGWLPGPESVHPSATYRELERLSGVGVNLQRGMRLVVPRPDHAPWPRRTDAPQSRDVA